MSRMPVSLCIGGAACLLATAQPVVAGSSSVQVAAQAGPAQAAWQRYRDALQRQRQELLGHELARDPALRAQALYFLQSMEALAFNMYVAPRQQYPALYTQSVYMPFELSWGSQNPDFLYHAGFIDGAHSYRISGNKNGSYWSVLQVQKGMWGDDAHGLIANIDLEDVPAKPNGDFEIFLGPNPPAQSDGRYWVRLDPSIHNIFLTWRETFYDWMKDSPIALHIENLDRNAGAPIDLTEDEISSRLGKAERFAEANVKNIFYTLGNFNKRGDGSIISNQYVVPAGTEKWGGNPLACYGMVFYDLKPDEALVVEMPETDAHYWGIQLSSVWLQTTDYIYHQSSINGKQARADADGRFRAVLTLNDPGVPNWLDPVGVRTGIMSFRWYRSKGCPTPTVTNVKITALRSFLPKDTPVIAPAQRRAELEVRSRAGLRRYGQ